MKNKVFLIIFASIGLLIGNYILYEPSIDIIKDMNNLSVHSYSDKVENGNSIVSYQLLDNGIKYSYRLESGHEFPYAGIAISRKDKSFFKLQNHSIRIKAKTHGSNSLYFRLDVYANNFTDTNNVHSYVFNQKVITGSNGTIDAVVDVESLEIPGWWTVDCGLMSDKIPQFTFDQTASIVFDHDLTWALSKESSVEITSLEFIPDAFYIKTFNLAVVIIMVVIFLWMFFLKKSKTKQIIVGVPYQQLELKVDEPQNKEAIILHHLSVNFKDNLLTLTNMSDTLGINSRDISEVIKNKYKYSFRQYLNFLRIEEAKRLLLTSELQIKEVALNVGYENQQHFLRVFKEVVGITPTEFKKQSI